ncbi:LBF_2804 family protein [Spirosoma rhododendri]|uniref:Uncharacterized protein n=1 Tax=Spirosoma rhododendri TaxID=2728024 RepID=A0A7L5DMM3_9BACT|nr:hypothetical protein [Spirosoma rhododendri]QJD78731.1 hypothetical protein HH216_10035 [Spirosoma rhododendri]
MRYLRRALDASHPTDEPYVLSDDELFLTQRAAYATLFASGFLGVLTVLLFQLPQFAWPDFFASTEFLIAGKPFAIPLITILYAVLVLYIAVHLTTGVNRFGARAIAQICQFPRLHDARYEHHVETMARLARSGKSGFRPYFNLKTHLARSRSGLFAYFLANQAAGFFASTIVTILLIPYIPTSAAIIIGLVGYVSWLVYSVRRIQFELKIRILAPLTIRSFVNELREEWHTNSEFQTVLTDVLNYAGILRRLHVYAHLVLVETLTDRVNEAILPHSPDDFLPQMAAMPPDMQRSVERLLVFSLLIDGRFTAKERAQLQKLQDHKLLTYSLTDIGELHKDYVAGKGLWL